MIGAETQSVTLRWAVRILACHPEVQRKVQDEIDDNVERGADVLWEDRFK